MNEESDRFPLHTAARQGRAVVAENLIKSDPKLANRPDDDGRYAIHEAASANSLDIVRALANQPDFDPDIKDGAGWTPLMIAASVPDGTSVVEVLLKSEADVNEKNNAGRTVLHLVASKKNLDVAELLIENSKPPASTRVRDRLGQYPIHRAAAVGSTPMVKLILKNKSPLNPTDNDGYTPLHHAIAEGHGDTAVELLKQGADLSIKSNDDILAIDLAPDKEVRRFIIQGAEREGIELSS